MSAAIPAALVRTIDECYGPAGREWLARLPALIADCERRWVLRVLPPLAGLSYNYVAPAVRADGTAVILKLGVPDRELLTEIAALRLYDGRGAVRLLDAEPDWTALLLERLQPGEPLAHLAESDDEQATSIAAQVMRQLWRPVPSDHPFPTLAHWFAGLGRLRQRFRGSTGPLPAGLVETAERLVPELLASAGAAVLLHGDLHHTNILRATRRPWLAIDPKGVVGDPAYEVGALLYNPLPQIASWPDLPRVLARRVDVLAAKLGFARERIVAWGIAQAVLSACWSVEDEGHGWEPVLVCGEVLAGLLRRQK